MRVRLAWIRGSSAAWIALAAVGLALLGPARATGQGTLSALETDVDQIARTARPSVVTVMAQKQVTRPSKRGTMVQRLHMRVGSGVAVEEQIVITTASVVSGADRLWIRTTNGLQVAAVVVGSDPVYNLALLRVADVRLPPLRLSLSRAPQEGEWVMAIGTSHFQAQITQSVGTIAYRHREPRLALLQLTNTVYPGYSGGAVLNARGQLIGIIQGELGLSSAANPSNDRVSGRASFVLPVATVLPAYQSLRKEGRIRHGYFGVSTRAASVESDTERGLRVPIGALVESVQPRGPAARLGLARGDLIVGFEGERVEYPEQLARWVAATPPGTAVDLVWVRDETYQSGKITLTESPEAVPKWAMLSPAPRREEASGTRIAELERQIQRLNSELERLKTEAASTPR